ncbi:MAG: glycoside hydrolase family 88 protein [Enterocloster asparagiformis]|nr:glycoside hydrolase family 88 protein [Enterocloster asparagiformis]
MIKKIQVEPVKNREKYLSTRLLTKAEVEQAMDRVVRQVRQNMEYIGDRFPTPAAKDGSYGVIDNIEWTDGFWTGLLWLCYEYTGDAVFREQADRNVASFLNRVEKRIELDHHDLGFLYSLSCVAGYKLTGSETARRAGLLAADKLMERFQEKGGFIQAWGALGAKDNYRLIIDCLLNIPLLYWAARETGDTRYENAARRHYAAACNNVIRDDASAYHTFYFDPESGEPVKGVTRQGYSDDSAWARGQAWGVYGLPLNYRYTRDESAFNLFEGMTNYFLNRLPGDDVCYWDLIFSDGSGQPRDSSAAAVAVCGIHEMEKYLPETHPDKEVYKYAMHRILRSLTERYVNPETGAGKPVLLHGVYSWHSGKGVDEGNIWGDYYYMEALVRFWKDWNLYW